MTKPRFDDLEPGLFVFAGVNLKSGAGDYGLELHAGEIAALVEGEV
jgi:hypothetical protein